MEESAVAGRVDPACKQQVPPPSLSLAVGMTTLEDSGNGCGLEASAISSSLEFPSAVPEPWAQLATLSGTASPQASG